MITLNLLPPDEKQKIESAQAQRKILSLGGAALILILVFLALLSFIWLFLAIQKNSADLIYKNIQANSQSEAFKNFESEAKKLNEKLSRADALVESSNHYSAALKKLTELAPQDIKFVTFSASQNKVNLEGFAASRDSLMAFKDSLSQSLYFDKVDMPLSNFLKQTNIDFFVSFEIK